MSFVSSEMESAATELFPALARRGATVQRHVCETCADDVCEAESAFSVCLQSLISAAVCSLVSAGFYLTISKKKKRWQELLSIRAPTVPFDPDKFWAGMLHSHIISLHNVLTKLRPSVCERCFGDLRANI